jgi:hypothetical protein
MASTSEWTESEILELITNQVQESLTLDYKACDALGRSEGKKKEISKDVSAFANSAGGQIVYGVLEDKHFPTKLDVGYDPNDISKEWVEQVINTNIQRRIDNVRINQIQLATHAPGRVLYVVSIPQSVRAPHMAIDHRFYKRFNFESVPMEEYEVRDVGRRQESPDLQLDVGARFDETGMLVLRPHVSNISPEPAFYAIFRLFLPQEWSVGSWGDWIPREQTILFWRGTRMSFRTCSQRWVYPRHQPILEGERYEAGQLQISGLQANISDIYHLGYELRTPKMLAKLGGLVLKVSSGTVQVEARPGVLQPL